MTGTLREQSVCTGIFENNGISLKSIKLNDFIILILEITVLLFIIIETTFTVF